MIVTQVTAVVNYNFGKRVQSNKVSFKELQAGPLPGYFAQCLSATECGVY